MRNLEDGLENHLETLLSEVELIKGHFNKNTVSLGDNKFAMDIFTFNIKGKNPQIYLNGVYKLGVLELLGVVDPSFAAFFEDLSKDPNHLFNYTSIQLSYTLAILLLIILPTLIIYIRLGFVNYLIIDKEIEVGNAFMLSYQLTKGKLGFIVLLYLAIIALNIIGLAFLLIGVLFTIPMSFMVISLAYRYLFPKEMLDEKNFLI